MKDAYYASRFTPDPNRSAVWSEIVRYHKRFIPENATVVDLGAGYCDFINLVRGKKKYAVDSSPELPNYAHASVEAIQAVAWDLSKISSDSVDVIHASNLFEHFSDDELARVMAEVKRVLKKGGKLILMQPNYRLAYKTYFDDPTHKKVFSDAALESFLVSHEMDVVCKMPRFLPFSLRSRPSIIPAHPLIVRAYLHSPVKPFAGQMLFVSVKK
ncbi:class I SAM-dependent methyltransferase [bacterium]|nr:class I SAM-dependent methyltransferase [bacterium]